MTRAWEVFRFELGYQAGRTSTRIYFALFLGFALVVTRVFFLDAQEDGYFFNAPIIIAATTIASCMVALLVAAGVAGDAATRDADARLDSLIFTTPLRKAAYLGGRLLGAFAVTAVLLLAVPLSVLASTQLPWIDPAMLGPFRAEAYLTSYFFFAVPNAFVATAVLFSIAALTRRAVSAYAGATALFLSTFLSEAFVAEKLNQWGLGKLVDPLGFTTLHAYWRSTNPKQRNTLLIGLDGDLLANRLIWLGLALALLAFAVARFRFAYAAGGRSWRRAMAMSDEPALRWTGLTVPIARRAFNASTRLRQFIAVTLRSFRELLSSKGWLIVPLAALAFVSSAPEILEVQLGVPGAATTGRVASIFLAFEQSFLIVLLIALYSGELMWRERDARVNAFADVTPVPEWLTFLGKFSSLTLMLLATQTVFLLCGVLVQAMQGNYDFDIVLYLKVLFGYQLSSYLLYAAVAMVVHVLFNQKYVGNVVVVLIWAVFELARELGVEHNLLLFGGAPEWSFSEMAGLGLKAGPWAWFTLYWSGWALLFGLITYLFWIRGEERGRLAMARRRLTRQPAVIGAIAIAIIAGAGGFVFYNTNILNTYYTDDQIDARRAAFERKYGQYETLPQPTLAATKLSVDFYPRRNAAAIKGSYRLDNHTGTVIDAIHLVVHPGMATRNVSFDRPSRLQLNDDDLGYRIYALGTPVQPGQSIRMQFEVAHEPRGFTNFGRNEAIMPNGSWIQHRSEQSHGERQWLPFVGYQDSRELNNPQARQRHGLPERPEIAPLDDAAARYERMGREKIELEVVVGTDADQTGVAPGELRRAWSENGRRYFHYVTDAPISNTYAIYSARYATRRASWRGMPIEVLHHPTHTANLDRMIRSVGASLDYHTRNFGPYPHRQLRLVEYPSSGHGLGLTSYPGMIEYSEGLALVRVEADERKIDFPFAVLGHEMGHQWWGHQLVPAIVEGAPVLSESLAWYTGMLVVEETFGREHLTRLLDVMRGEYLAPHQSRTVPLLRATSWLDGYRIGPFSLFALREAVGDEPVNAALRKLLKKFDPSRPPYATSRDLYAELRAVTPPSMHYLLKDLFEEITFWDLKMKSVAVRGNRVAMQIEAQKLKGNTAGKEKPAPMNDIIQVAVFDADGKALYRRPHRITSGEQTIEVAVAGKAAGAAIDPDHSLLDRNPWDNSAKP